MAVDIDFDADLAKAVSDLPGQFVWGGTTYDAVITPVREGGGLGLTGILVDRAFEIHVQTSKFSGTRPTKNDQITVLGDTCRIETVSVDEADAGLVLTVQQDTGRR